MATPVPRCTHRTVFGVEKNRRARLAPKAYPPSTSGRITRMTPTMDKNPPTDRRFSSTTVGSTARKKIMVLGFPIVSAREPRNRRRGRSWGTSADDVFSALAGDVHNRKAKY